MIIRDPIGVLPEIIKCEDLGKPMVFTLDALRYMLEKDADIADYFVFHLIGKEAEFTFQGIKALLAALHNVEDGTKVMKLGTFGPTKKAKAEYLAGYAEGMEKQIPTDPAEQETWIYPEKGLRWYEGLIGFSRDGLTLREQGRLNGFFRKFRGG